MLIIAFLFIFFCIFKIQIVDQNLYDYISKTGQSICSKAYTGLPSPHAQLYRALSCGINPESHSYDALKKSALWHVVVGWGGHLVTLSLIMDWIFNSRKKHSHSIITALIKSLIFLGFAFFHGFGAPVVRSLGQAYVTLCSRNLKWQLLTGELVLFSGCLSLLFFSFWTESLSLQLSWLATLALVLGRGRSFIVQCTLIYLFTLPIMWLIQFPHPYSILFNLFFAHFLSMILFPMALLVILMPSLYPFIDSCVGLIMKLINFLTNLFDPIFFDNQVLCFTRSFLVSWSYVLVLNLIVIHCEQQRYARHE